MPTVIRDQFFLPERDALHAAGNWNTAGRRLVTGRTGVLVLLGQSNNTNCASEKYVVGNIGSVLNFSVYDGGLYRAAEPLLGCGVTGGHPFASRLADMLINSAGFDRVILIPIAIGATEILDWIPSGEGRSTWMWPRVQTMWRRYAASGLPAITGWLWMIGEQDAGNPHSGTTQAQFVARFEEFRAAVRELGSDAPIFMPQETHPHEAEPPYRGQQIRAAQAAVVNPALGVYAGPDCDLIGDTYRPDGVHFGVSDSPLAQAWFDKLVAVYH